MTDTMTLAKRTADELQTVRAYVGSDPIRAVVGLLDALDAQYRADFENVTVEGLIPLQTAIRQVAALKRSILADGAITPKIF